MSEIKRHIGKTTNTDRRLVVVFMQIPGREDHALVIDTDALPHRFHDDLMAVVEGEGQAVANLGDLLGRRVMPYSGENMLATLHANNALQAVPVANVLMLPQPNRPIALPELLKMMGKSTTESAPPVEEVKTTEYRDNRIVENQAIDRNNEKYQIASNILLEAQMLTEEAARKRESAYEIYPALRPVAAPVAVKVDVAAAAPEQAAEVLKEVKAKRSRTKKAEA